MTRAKRPDGAFFITTFHFSSHLQDDRTFKLEYLSVSGHDAFIFICQSTDFVVLDRH
jgi:hypothetical protein